MLKRLRPSPAMVVALIALFVAIPSIIVTLMAPFNHPDVTKRPAKA